MPHKWLFSFLAILVMSVFACGSNTPIAPAPFPTDTLVVPKTAIPSVSHQPLQTATMAAGSTTTIAAVSTATFAPIPTAFSTNVGGYIDDRSTPITLITSLFNAVNRKEYLRAYSYWSNPTTSLGSLTSFTNGYADTASVNIVFGTITSGAGAGQVYYTVPVLLKGIATNGQPGNYAACYVIHLARPENFGEPPIHPMSIDRGTAKSVPLVANDSAALSSACTGPDYPITNPVTIGASTLNIDASNYVDNRSGPIETVSSYLNALNTKQYVRAYSYWQNPASALGPYDSYANGFTNTASVNVTFGTMTSDAGAGQLHYKVPLAMIVVTPNNLTQTFVGCYTLHLAQPAVQSVYPFEPMGIAAGKFRQYGHNVDINPLLKSACS